MNPSKLEREVLILQRCNSETVALIRALDQPAQPVASACDASVPAAPQAPAPSLH